MKKTWQKAKFDDYVEINPKVKLERGEEHPFVMMEAISPGTKCVSPSGEKQFKGGGSKFEDMDTLFARITPCLENGKIAFYRGNPAFGSTEFFIFRAKSGISDPDYIYYLSTTKTIRGPAEKSMAGASGRQRADIASIKDLIIDFPDLPTQRRIAAILSAYDDLIENNNRRIKILEQMAQMIYREWFVDFRFPGHEKVKMVNSKLGKIPGGWEVRRLGDVLDLVYGDALKAEDRIEGPIPVYGSSGIIGYHNESMVKGPGIIVGRKGNVGSVYWSDDDFFPIDTVYYVQTDKSSPFIYFNLLTQNFINNDAAVPGLNRKQALNLPIIIPTEGLLKIFESAILPVFKYIKQIKQESDNLRQTRDLLLPKLVSGEVEV